MFSSKLLKKYCITYPIYYQPQRIYHSELTHQNFNTQFLGAMLGIWAFVLPKTLPSDTTNAQMPSVAPHNEIVVFQA